MARRRGKWQAKENSEQQLAVPHGLLLTAYAGNGLMRLSTRMPSRLSPHHPLPLFHRTSLRKSKYFMLFT